MPMQEPKMTGVKKRQQIETASRKMFAWVAVAAVAVSICIVSAQFFFQQFMYNNRVISAKSKAADTLKTNIDNSQKLKQEVDALVGSQELASVKTNPKDSSTKSVLDALPSVFDQTALATSLQRAILGRSSVAIESISVMPVSPDAIKQAEAESKPVEQPFSITVTGTYDQVRRMILDLERTIRPMKVMTLSVNGSDAAMQVSVSAVTYWQPAKTTNVKMEVVK